MVLVYQEKEIATLEDIQKLKVKDLKEILRSNSEATGGMKADLVLKVYAILMRNVLQPAENRQENVGHGGDFQYDETIRRISALGWSTDLRQLPELNFIQLYDYLVVSTRKYRHIVPKGTNYKKLKSYQFFFEGNVKRLESKIHEDKTYVKARVLPSMKKTPYRVVVEFKPQCDIMRAACTCPAGLGLLGKGKCNHVGGVLFALEDFTRQELQKHPEPLSCTSRLSVWVVPRNQSAAAKPLDQVLIRKIRFGKKNIRMQPKLIKFDPRALHQRTRDVGKFRTLGEDLQNCLASSSFFLFHDLKPKCSEVSPTEEVVHEQIGLAFTDSYDIATNRFKRMMNEHVLGLTITDEEIQETERLTRGQTTNNLWFEKRKTILTASNFGKAAKTKKEPSNKVKAILYSNFTTESVQYGIESEPKAVDLFVSQMNKEGMAVKVEEVGLLMSKEKPYLGASLDRILTFVDTNEKWGREIKSPFSKAGMTVEDACKSKNFYLEKLADASIQLKSNHDYFWQVQGQLYCSNLSVKGIIFTVYFGDNMPLFMEKIPFHSSTWYEHFLPKIDCFYRRAFLPEILTRRVQRGKLLYLHGGWLSYGQYSCSRTGLKLRFQRET